MKGKADVYNKGIKSNMCNIFSNTEIYHSQQMNCKTFHRIRHYVMDRNIMLIKYNIRKFLGSYSWNYLTKNRYVLYKLKAIVNEDITLT